MSTPVRTISFAPRSSSRSIASRTASNGRVRLAPRACQIEQKVQRWSHPVWIATKLRTLPWKPAGTGDGMTSLFQAESFAGFPTTRSTPGIARNVSGSSSAAQPVTRIFASGRWRCARRMACRDCRTASLVTAQLLTMVQSSPVGAIRASVSLSAKLRRQPRVTVSTLTPAPPGRARPRTHGSRGRASGSARRPPIRSRAFRPAW